MTSTLSPEALTIPEQVTLDPTAPVGDLSTVTLDPDYRLAGAIVILALPLSLISSWITVLLISFGCFLITQTGALRLVFTATALEVYRQGSQIRHFPYADWKYWQLYTPETPILFYFREVKSIHFLPMLFDPNQLQTQLQYRIPNS